MRVIYILALSFTLSGILGCASRQDALQKSVENYVKALRRGDSDIALSYVHPDKREEFAKSLERLDQDLLISQIDLKSVTPDDEMKTAVMTVLMEYIQQSSSGVSVKKSNFLWKYDEKRKAWLLESATPFLN